MSNIGDLILRVIADMTGFEVEVEKKAAATGDKAGQTFGQRMASNAGKAFATVVGGALAIATTQGLKLNQVLNDLQADTGAVGDEWEAMSSVVRRENGRTTESVEEIAAAVRGMKQDLGLTGEEIDRYADRIFDAGLATRKGAAFIVAAADDIGDAFQLDLDRSLGVIDQLIVSQQKFGGSVEDRLSVLAELAPALLALHLTEEDGIELLNAAAASGLEVTDVLKGLRATAVNLDRPFDEWLRSIGAIADDQLRLAAASDVVGARAGLAMSTLARALFEATVAGETFAVSQDEAADAATNMADKIDSGPIRAIKLMGEQLGAFLADVGANPAITGIASVAAILEGFAPNLTGKIAGALLKGLKGIGVRMLALIGIEMVASSAVTTAAATTVGAEAGTAFGRAMALAIPAGMVLVAAAIGIALAMLINELFPDVAKSMADNFGRGVEAVKRAISNMADEIGRAFGGIGRGIDMVASAFGRAADFILSVLSPVREAIEWIMERLDDIPLIGANERSDFGGRARGGSFGTPMPTLAPAAVPMQRPGDPFWREPIGGYTGPIYGYQHGIDWAPEGLAYIHEGEAVLTRAENERRLAGESMGDNITIHLNQPQLAQGVTGPDVVRSLRHVGAYGRFRDR